MKRLLTNSEISSISGGDFSPSQLGSFQSLIGSVMLTPVLAQGLTAIGLATLAPVAPVAALYASYTVGNYLFPDKPAVKPEPQPPIAIHFHF